MHVGFLCDAIYSGRNVICGGHCDYLKEGKQVRRYWELIRNDEPGGVSNLVGWKPAVR